MAENEKMRGNKIGKFSTGLKGATKESPYGDCNGGYEKRSNSMGVYNSLSLSMKAGGTATGKPVPVTVKK